MHSNRPPPPLPPLLYPPPTPCASGTYRHPHFTFFYTAELACACMQALEKGAFKAGQRVLIQAGSGGVGSWLVQLAKSQGLHVTTTCSTPNIDFCKKVGAGTYRVHGSALCPEALCHMATYRGVYRDVWWCPLPGDLCPVLSALCVVPALQTFLVVQPLFHMARQKAPVKLQVAFQQFLCTTFLVLTEANSCYSLISTDASNLPNQQSLPKQQSVPKQQKESFE